MREVSLRSLAYISSQNLQFPHTSHLTSTPYIEMLSSRKDRFYLFFIFNHEPLFHKKSQLKIKWGNKNFIKILNFNK